MAGWLVSDHKNRIKVTINNSEVAANETDFPWSYDLSELPSSFFTKVQSDGRDIRVTQSDGVTEEAIHVVTIDTGAETGQLNGNGSSVSSGTDTVYYIYYNSATATMPAVGATYGQYNAYRSTIMAYYPCEDGSGGTLTDMTSNGRDGTESGTITNTAAVWGDGINAGTTGVNKIDLPDFTPTDGFSMYGFFNRVDGGGSRALATKWSDTGGTPRQAWYWWVNASGEHEFAYVDTDLNFADVTGGSLSTNTTYHLGVTYDHAGAGEVQLYKDGAVDGAAGATTEVLADVAKTDTLFQKSDGTVAGQGHRGWGDQLYIVNEVLDANFFETVFNNQVAPGDFFTTGTEETRFIPTIIII